MLARQHQYITNRQGGIRTPDQRIRSAWLYSTELLALDGLEVHTIVCLLNFVKGFHVLLETHILEELG